MKVSDPQVSVETSHRDRLLEIYDNDKYRFQEGGTRCLRSGPLRQRHCTDIICLVLFVAIFFAVIGYAGYAFSLSKASVLDLFVHPIDYKARRCGMGDMKEFKYVFHTPNGKDWSPVCTSACPMKGVPAKCNTVDKTICNSYTPTDTVKILRFCFPKSTWQDHIQNSSIRATLIGSMNDVKDAWLLYCVGALIAIVLCFVMLLFLKVCTSAIILFAIMLCVALFSGIAFFVFHEKEWLIKEGLDDTLVNIFGGIAATIAGVVALLSICCCKSIRISCKLIQTAAYFLMDVKSQMTQPTIFVVFHSLFLVLFILCGVFIWTMDAKGGESYCCVDKSCKVTSFHPFCVKYTWEDRNDFYVFIIAGLGFFFYGNGMISALSQFTTAYSAGVWYFAGTDENGDRALPGGNSFCDFRLTCKGMATGIGYHTGTFSFGAMICAICKVLNALAQKAANDAEKSGNCATKVLMRCLQFLSCCLERCVSFISSQAYIHTALLGTAFCESAKSGFSVTVRHPIRTLMARTLGSIFRWCCVLLTVGITSVIGYFLLRTEFFGSGVDSPVGPLIVLATFVTLIAWSMSHPFNTALLTIMHCFCADEEMSKHAGHTQARHAPPALRSFLGQLEDSERVENKRLVPAENVPTLR